MSEKAACFFKLTAIFFKVSLAGRSRRIRIIPRKLSAKRSLHISPVKDPDCGQQEDSSCHKGYCQGFYGIKRFCVQQRIRHIYAYIGALAEDR